MRNKSFIAALTVTLCLIIAGSAWSRGQIYRWVDDQGTVHYGQIVPDGVEATAVGVRPNTIPSVSAPKPGRDDENAATEGNSEGTADEDISYAEQRRRDRAEKQQEQAKKDQQLARECDIMRKQKAFLEPSPRVLIRGEDGTVQRLDDDKRQSALDEANAFLAENCNG